MKPKFPDCYPPLLAHYLPVAFRNGCLGYHIPVFFNALFPALKTGGETASSVVRRLSPLNLPFDESGYGDYPLLIKLILGNLAFSSAASCRHPRPHLRDTDHEQRGQSSPRSILSRAARNFFNFFFFEQVPRYLLLILFLVQFPGMCFDERCGCALLGHPCFYHILPSLAYWFSWGKGWNGSPGRLEKLEKILLSPS